MKAVDLVAVRARLLPSSRALERVQLFFIAPWVVAIALGIAIVVSARASFGHWPSRKGFFQLGTGDPAVWFAFPVASDLLGIAVSVAFVSAPFGLIAQLVGLAAGTLSNERRAARLVYAGLYTVTLALVYACFAWWKPGSLWWLVND
jgi:hypothetical protein